MTTKGGSAMKKLLLALLLVLVLPLFLISCSSESVDPAWEGKIKNILLEQKEWTGEMNSKWGPCLHDYVFEDRGDKIIAKIHCNRTTESCKQKIKINSDGFRVTDCTAGIVDFIYDPNDPVYRFTTKVDNMEFALKLKAKNI
jgi:hypothetical protein